MPGQITNTIVSTEAFRSLDGMPETNLVIFLTMQGNNFSFL